MSGSCLLISEPLDMDQEVSTVFSRMFEVDLGWQRIAKSASVAIILCLLELEAPKCSLASVLTWWEGEIRKRKKKPPCGRTECHSPGSFLKSMKASCSVSSWNPDTGPDLANCPHSLTSKLTCCNASKMSCRTSASSKSCIKEVAKCLQADIHAVWATFPGRCVNIAKVLYRKAVRSTR